jgi:serine/threonine protein kinase
MARPLEILEQVLALPPEEQEAAIDRLCNGDEALRREVEQLVSLDQDSEGFLEPMPIDGSASAPDGNRTAGAGAGRVPTPETIGEYRIEEKLGEGGFGIVYSAQQSGPIDRRVAIKVIKPGMDSEAVLRRFDAERRALALLEHPNIARVYDGGVIPENEPGAGRPYFVMEFVDGDSVTKYAESEGTPLPEKLDLVLQICAAAHHAHTKGIIHRDLKPANVLVTRIDGKPACKIIDFGIAKALVEAGGGGTHATAMTSPGAMVGTPQYMSPEQARGSLDIDTRADVYAIGVLLYELIAGRPPFDMQGVSATEAVRRVSEDKPERLGTVAPAARGDLETIVAKAMDKNADLRYASAAELAADIRRCLNSETVLARPPSLTYQFSRFAKRNRGLVTVSSIAVLGIVGGLISTTIALREARAQTVVARDAAEEAREQADIAEAIEAFLTEELINQANTEIVQQGDPTVRQLLDNASDNIEGRFVDTPLVEMRLRRAIGLAYRSLGVYDRFSHHMRKAFELSQTARGRLDEGTLWAQHAYTTSLLEQRDFEGALTECLELRPKMVEVFGSASEAELQVLTNLGACYMQLGRLEEGAEVLAETAELKKQTLGPRHVSTLVSIGNLAGAYIALGRLEESRDLYEEAFTGRNEVLGTSDPRSLFTAAGYARCESMLGNYDRARELIESARVTAKEHLPEDHPMHGRLEGTAKLIEEDAETE